MSLYFIEILIERKVEKEYKNRGIDISKLRGESYEKFQIEVQDNIDEFSEFLVNIWKETKYNDFI